jgi:choline dehydrogenase
MSLMSLSLKLLTVCMYLLREDAEHKLIGDRQVFDKSYDFIVVGSGSAGGVVAHRLAENPRIHVLLLEAGGPAGIPTDIPMEYQPLFQSEYDWNYTEAKQPVGLAFKDGRIQENRGKVLGGSSSVNAMVYNRGNRQTFDDWAHEFWAEGWTYRGFAVF